VKRTEVVVDVGRIAESDPLTIEVVANSWQSVEKNV